MRPSMQAEARPRPSRAKQQLRKPALKPQSGPKRTPRADTTLARTSTVAQAPGKAVRERTVAIILSGGRGIRFRGSQPKQFAKLAGRMVIEYTVDVFQKHRQVDQIVLVVQPDFIDYTWDLAKRNNWTKVTKIVSDGPDRFDSTASGLAAVQHYPPETKLLVHDVIRPLVTPAIINDCLDRLNDFDAVDVVIPSADNLVELYDNNVIKNIPDRSSMRRSQTPQGFRLGTIVKAFEIAAAAGQRQFTSECGVVRSAFPQLQVATIPGSFDNVKIIFPIDLYMAEKTIQLGQSSTLQAGRDFSWIRGQTVVVFGGSSGIGLEIANLAHVHGARTFAASRARNAVDVRSAASVQAFLEQVHAETGSIHHVINTAGILIKKPAAFMTDEEVQALIDINYKGTFNVARAALPYLKESRGSLLNFASSSYTRGRSLYALYSSSKAAVVNLTQALSEEWACDGIRVNCINPERTATPMRSVNFGHEPAETLLDPREVAAASLGVLNMPETGVIYDVHKDRPAQRMLARGSMAAY